MITINLCKDKDEADTVNSAYIISTILAEKGYKVLAIDLDSQAKMTHIYSLEAALSNKAFDVLAGDKSFDSYIKKTHKDNLYLLPSDCCLKMIELTKGRDKAVMNEFSKMLTRMKETFDYVVIDNETGFGELPLIALVTGNYATVPTQIGILQVCMYEDTVQYFKGPKGCKSKKEDLNILFTWFDSGAECTIAMSMYPDNHNVLKDIWDEY